MTPGREPSSTRDGAATGGGAGAPRTNTGGSAGSSPTGTGGFGGAGSAAGSSGSAGADRVDAAAVDPETGTDAQPLADAVDEITMALDTGTKDVSSTDASVVGPDITASGTIIAFILAPVGGGNKNLEVIRDGDTPPVGSTDSTRQYDSFTNDPQRTEDWIGYSFASATSFTRVVFQDGRRFPDGGWFASLKVQVQQANVWVDVPGVSTSPPYAGMASPNFTTYQFDFAPISGNAIRIDGAPAGTNKFISVGELRVFRTGP